MRSYAAVLRVVVAFTLIGCGGSDGGDEGDGSAGAGLAQSGGTAVGTGGAGVAGISARAGGMNGGSTALGGAANGGALARGGGGSSSGGTVFGGSPNAGSTSLGGGVNGGAATIGGNLNGGAPALGGGLNGGAPELGGSSSGGEQGLGGGTDGGAVERGGATTGGAELGGSAQGGSSGSEEYPVPSSLPDEDGSELWLRYPIVPIPGRLGEYQAAFTYVVQADESPTLQAAQSELVKGLSGLTGVEVAINPQLQGAGGVVLGTASSTVIASLPIASRLATLGPEEYLVEATQAGDQSVIAVAANTELGVLYGSFALLRHLQCHRPVAGLALSSAPRIQHRILNHWDNLDRTVERGYAGQSLWNWGALPNGLSQSDRERYVNYARANASIGINGTVLTNVNANAQVLTAQYLDKVKALADLFRPYGISVYLTARFSAPIEIGGQSTADPTNSAVKQWWVDKADEIYELIPDFGGFLVKANSEGQPGPGDYGRSHADGANMLADAVRPHGGIVLWRAFVYSQDSPVDRIRQAYEEFHPLDGQFAENVLVQSKNGPLDFQPREPFSPLFGAMTETPLALELQITKEYLGEDTHLAYLGTLYEEVLKADTGADAPGGMVPTVARVIDGTLHGYATTAISGVANIGTDTNWTGSHFNQANWYVYGRMAWDPDLTAAAVADEWIRQTLSNDPAVVSPVTQMMMDSREALVNYMTPLGLAHIMGSDHHYGPAPWVSNLSRPEWNPVYYHKADTAGLGFDRTASGSNAVEQYFSSVRDTLSNRSTIPEELVLFFHHVGWQETMSSGRSLWEELVYRYSLGVDQVAGLRESWATIEGRVDAQRFEEVTSFLQLQHWESRWWRDACLQYFRTFSNLAIPDGYAQPAHDLSYYQGLNCPSNVTKPRCDAINSGEPSPAILE